MRCSLPCRFFRTTSAQSFAGGPGEVYLRSTAEPGHSAVPPSVRYYIFSKPVPYHVAATLRQRILDARLDARERCSLQGGGQHDVLLLMEHTPTYAIPGHDAAAADLRLDAGARSSHLPRSPPEDEELRLRRFGANIFRTKSPGYAAYHGPGQLAGYPILDLNAMESPPRAFVIVLEALLAQYVRDLGADLLSPHPHWHVGVYASLREKLASINVDAPLPHRITSGGFSLNVSPKANAWMDLIEADGLNGVASVTLHELLYRNLDESIGGDGGPLSLPSVQDVATGLLPRFSDTLQRELVPLTFPERGDDNAELAVYRQLVEDAEAAAVQFIQERGHHSSSPLQPEQW